MMNLVSSKLKKAILSFLAAIQEHIIHPEMVVQHLQTMKRKFFMVATSFFQHTRVSTPDNDST